MSAMTDAWSALYVAKTNAVGGPQLVTIGAHSNIAGILEAVPLDVEFADGSLGYAGPFTIMVLATSVSSTEPEKNTAVTFTPVGSVRAVSLSVLDVKSVDGVMYVTAGDPNAQ